MEYKYPLMDNMNAVELLILRKLVSQSTDPSDVEFRNEIDARIKEIALTPQNKRDEDIEGGRE